jgi:hypothetical protein
MVQGAANNERAMVNGLQIRRYIDSSRGTVIPAPEITTRTRSHLGHADQARTVEI